MPLFRKKAPPISYDPVAQQPALRRSICTGEMTAGFADRDTGRFHELMLLRGEGELEEFCRRVGVRREELKIIY